MTGFFHIWLPFAEPIPDIEVRHRSTGDRTQLTNSNKGLTKILYNFERATGVALANILFSRNYILLAFFVTCTTCSDRDKSLLITTPKSRYEYVLDNLILPIQYVTCPNSTGAISLWTNYVWHEHLALNSGNYCFCHISWRHQRA